MKRSNKKKVTINIPLLGNLRYVLYIKAAAHWPRLSSQIRTEQYSIKDWI